jgi:diguanylate cyclase (GGDEF)-like protein
VISNKGGLGLIDGGVLVSAVEAHEGAARLLPGLPQALENGQVVAYFQPEVELSTGHVIAAEALVRWEHPDFGTLSPALFLPLAAKLGLMDKLTRRMLRLSLDAHRTWAAAGWSIPVSLNIGPECVRDPDFPDFVAESLRSYQVPGRMLALEVSEQTATAVSTSFFAQLTEVGVRIAVDDFGTGFSSLERLGGWPFDELKLDISLVRPMADSASFRTIVRTAIDLAHQLGARVVAEGVETEAVRAELKALGCDFGQGYLFGRAMPPELFTAWLREGDQPSRRRSTGVPQVMTPVATPATPPHRYPVAGASLRAGLRHWLGGLLRRARDQVGGATLATSAALLVLYGLWQVFRWGGHQHQALIGDLSFFPVNGFAAVYAWRASLRADLGRAICRAWRVLSVALWLFLFGDMLQLVYEVGLHERAYPTWADAAYLSFYVVAFAGLIAFPSRRRTRSERLRLVLDLGTVFVGGATLIWYVALGSAVATAHDFAVGDLVTFAYPVGDLLLLFGVVSLLWRGVPRSSAGALKIFGSGLIVFIAADVSYDYITVHSSYAGGDPVDTLWIVALLILYVAASCQLRATPSREFTTPLDGLAGRPSILPYVAIGSSYFLLTVVGLKDLSFNPAGGVLLGAVTLTILASLRQFVALRDNSRLALRYQALAAVDGITGLYNRRHFMEVAESLFAHAQRAGQPLAALMLDVDHFKQINDMHGHALGDRVLADLARSCRDLLRPDDIAGRYGGDEFAIMLPGATAADAAQIAARLTGPPARVAGRDGTPVVFTISVGVAEATGCRDLQSLLARADHALYEAKRAGRGCCRSFDDGPRDQVSSPGSSAESG